MTRVTAAAAGLLLAAACSSSPPTAPTAPTTTPTPVTPAGDLSGRWTGTGVDSYSAERVTWTLTQSGTGVSGRVDFDPVDPSDGSCASCHKLRRGTVTGTIAGGALTLTMSFPAGGDVPTPICVTDLRGSATVVDRQITGEYAGSDTCEGLFANGRLALTREP